jgi:hypothetical protein
MSRKLVVEIVGDSASLERAFKRSTKASKQFDRSMESTAVATTRRFSAMRAGIAGGVAALGISDLVQVAAESQQVLGQTSVAVESAGLSWKQYGDEIQNAIQAQSQFGFDDEALLRSFSLFVRNAGDVDEALRRNQIAMDISRARFISLEQAAQIVNKAALGQSGALRRLGIDARKGASGVELLAQLERQFGGAAEKASGDAATAMERLQVQTENAKESLGTLALPVVTELATVLGDAAAQAETLGDNLQRAADIKVPGGGGGRIGDIFREAAGQALRRQVPGIDALTMLRPLIDGAEKAGEEAGRRAGDSFQTALREHLDQVNRTFDRAAKPPTGDGGGVTAGQRNTWFDAMVGRRADRVQDINNLKAQLAELGRIADLIRERMAVTKDPTRRLTLEDKLVGVLRDQRSVQEEIAQQSRDAVQAEKDRLEAIKAANAALKERADQIKAAILDRLQARQTDVLNKRALRDAKERLRIARQIGTAAGIRKAGEGVADVRADILQQRIQNAPATLTKGGRFQLGNIVTININGVTDPTAVANRVAAVLKKRGRRTTTQSRGAAAGTGAGAH